MEKPTESKAPVSRAVETAYTKVWGEENVVALIAKRFHTDVCSAYLLEPDRANLVLAATVGLRRECIGNLRMAVH